MFKKRLRIIISVFLMALVSIACASKDNSASSESIDLITGTLDLTNLDESSNPLVGVKFEILNEDKEVINTVITDEKKRKFQQM